MIIRPLHFRTMYIVKLSPAQLCLTRRSDRGAGVLVQCVTFSYSHPDKVVQAHSIPPRGQQEGILELWESPQTHVTVVTIGIVKK